MNSCMRSHSFLVSDGLIGPQAAGSPHQEAHKVGRRMGAKFRFNTPPSFRRFAWKCSVRHFAISAGVHSPLASFTLAYEISLYSPHLYFCRLSSADGERLRLAREHTTVHRRPAPGSTRKCTDVSVRRCVSRSSLPVPRLQLASPCTQGRCRATQMRRAWRSLRPSAPHATLPEAMCSNRSRR